MANWCTANCKRFPPNCPASMCQCNGGEESFEGVIRECMARFFIYLCIMSLLTPLDWKWYNADLSKLLELYSSCYSI